MAKLKKSAENIGHEIKKGAEFIGHEIKENTVSMRQVCMISRKMSRMRHMMQRVDQSQRLIS
jgi:hypothetical protein